MTGADLLLLYFRTAIALLVIWYFGREAFIQPPLPERDRLFCERWVALGLGIIMIIGCSVAMRFVQGEGAVIGSAKMLGKIVVWLLV
jgi:hypothetical protein